MAQQKAFHLPTKLRGALEKMGFDRPFMSEGNYLEQKIVPPPVVDVITFVRVSTDLMKEQKLPFNEVMQLLINDIPNPALREAIKEINTELKQGNTAKNYFCNSRL